MDSRPSPTQGPAAGLRRFRPFAGPLSNRRSRPNCDIGRAGSGRPLPDPTADLGTLSVQAQKSDGPDPERTRRLSHSTALRSV